MVANVIPLHAPVQDVGALLNTVHQAECIAFMRTLPDACVDLIATDPPYRFQQKNFYRTQDPSAVTNKFKKVHLRKLSHVDTHMGLSFDPIQYLEECERICRGFNGYFFCNKDLVPDYINWAKGRKYSFDILLWDKVNCMPNHNQHYLIDKEYCIFIRKSGAYFQSKLQMQTYRTVKRYPYQKKRTSHPTEKPVAMLRELILVSSPPGAVVFDGFTGSGTTAIAAQQTGRNFLGCDWDATFVREANEQLAQLPLLTEGFQPLKKARVA